MRPLRFGPSPMRASCQYIFTQMPRDRGITAAEIGVWEGQNASTWIFPTAENSIIKFNEIILVDPLKGQAQLDAIGALTEHFPVVKFINTTSMDAASKFKDEYFDFIYIDAIHYYADVAADLAAWHSKVKKGGFIAGHDYDADPMFDVNRAVDEFAKGKNTAVIKFHTEFCIKKTW